MENTTNIYTAEYLGKKLDTWEKEEELIEYVKGYIEYDGETDLLESFELCVLVDRYYNTLLDMQRRGLDISNYPDI